MFWVACPACPVAKTVQNLLWLGIMTRAFLRFAVPLRLKGQDSPSVASPFGGVTVQWTVTEIRLTPGPRPAGALRASNFVPDKIVNTDTISA